MTETQFSHCWVRSPASAHMTTLFSTISSLGLAVHGQYLLSANSRTPAGDSASPLGSSPRAYCLGHCRHLPAREHPCVSSASEHALTTSYVLGRCSVLHEDLDPWWDYTGKTFSIRQMIKQKTTQISRPLLMNMPCVHQFISLGKNLKL